MPAVENFPFAFAECFLKEVAGLIITDRACEFLVRFHVCESEIGARVFFQPFLEDFLQIALHWHCASRKFASNSLLFTNRDNGRREI